MKNTDNLDTLSGALCYAMGIESPALPFEDSLYMAYETKRKEFQRTDLELD